MILPQHEKHYILETLKRLTAYVEALPAKQECATCNHFDVQTKKCAVNNYMIPPEEVQKTGCSAWEWDYTPF